MCVCALKKLNKRGTRPDLLFLPIKSSVKNSFSMNFFKFPTNCTKLLKWHILSLFRTSRINWHHISGWKEPESFQCWRPYQIAFQWTVIFWEQQNAIEKRMNSAQFLMIIWTKYYIHSFWNCHQRTLASCLPRRHSTRQERTIWQAIRYAFWAQYS